MISEPEFRGWKKIGRFNREIIITEKIDGTNGLIYVGPDVPNQLPEFFVGSRSKWITPDNDNHGFARWAYEHQAELSQLGPGYHYGEWWGNGIQRGYGMPSGVRNFSLFNVSRWSDPLIRPSCCGIVPIMYQGPFLQIAINNCLDELRMSGSKVAPFMNPEGIVIWHTALNRGFKITFENDEKGKSE